MFLFPETSRPAVGPTQPLIQWVPALLLRVKCSGLGVNYIYPSDAEVKNEWIINAAPSIRLYVVYRDYLLLPLTVLTSVCNVNSSPTTFLI